MCERVDSPICHSEASKYGPALLRSYWQIRKVGLHQDLHGAMSVQKHPQIHAHRGNKKP